jgi:hypothetical protein
VVENIETVGFESKSEKIAYCELPTYTQIKLLKRKSPQSITAESALDIEPSAGCTRWFAECPNTVPGWHPAADASVAVAPKGAPWAALLNPQPPGQLLPPF